VLLQPWVRLTVVRDQRMRRFDRPTVDGRRASALRDGRGMA